MPPMTKPTDAEIIDRLGGPAEVARLCGITDRRNVANWKARGIPDGWRKYLEVTQPRGFVPTREKSADGAPMRVRDLVSYLKGKDQAQEIEFIVCTPQGGLVTMDVRQQPGAIVKVLKLVGKR